MILRGPPGVGKTTLARLMANAFDAEFIALSAVLSGVKDIREAVERAEQYRAHGRRTLVFVDEVHRFNKSQQDAFLPHVESGLFTFIGATTENPSFEVNGALLSRAAVYVLKSLDDAELKQLVLRASEELGGLAWEDEALQLIVGSADGDGRKLLNNIEIVARRPATRGRTASTRRCWAARWPRTCAASTRAATRSTTRSARCTSRCAGPIRTARCTGSAACSTAAPTRATWRGASCAWPGRTSDLPIRVPHASHWMRPRPTSGSARPRASWRWRRRCCTSPSPRSRMPATTPTTPRAAFVAKDKSRQVPVHLRNAPTKLMKELGYGHAYRYAHDEPEAYAAGEHYLPDDLRRQDWYQPTPRGLEGKIGDKLRHLRDLDAACAGGTANIDRTRAVRKTEDDSENAEQGRKRALTRKSRRWVPVQ